MIATYKCPKCKRVQDIDAREGVQYYCKHCKVEMKPLPTRQAMLYPAPPISVHQDKAIEGGKPTKPQFKRPKRRPKPLTTMQARDKRAEQGTRGLREFGVQVGDEALISEYETIDDGEGFTIVEMDAPPNKFRWVVMDDKNNWYFATNDIDEAKRIIPRLVYGEPTKIKVHGVPKTRRRCVECGRGLQNPGRYSGYWCMIHGEVEPIDLATYKGKELAYYEMMAIEIALNQYFDSKRGQSLSYEQVAKDTGIDIKYLSKFMQSESHEGKSFYEMFKEVYGVEFMRNKVTKGLGYASFIGSCVDNPFDDENLLTEIIDRGIEITRDEFLANADLSDMTWYGQPLIPIMMEYPNSFWFYKTTWGGQTIWFYENSRIEYFFK